MGRARKYGDDRELMKGIIQELYFNGLSMRKISKLLNVSLTTVYNLIHEL